MKKLANGIVQISKWDRQRSELLKDKEMLLGELLVADFGEFENV